MKKVYCDICKQEIVKYPECIDIESGTIDMDLYNIIKRWNYNDFHKKCLHACINAMGKAVYKEFCASYEEARK